MNDKQVDANRVAATVDLKPRFMAWLAEQDDGAGSGEKLGAAGARQIVDAPWPKMVRRQQGRSAGGGCGVD